MRDLLKLLSHKKWWGLFKWFTYHYNDEGEETLHVQLLQQILMVVLHVICFKALWNLLFTSEKQEATIFKALWNILPFQMKKEAICFKDLWNCVYSSRDTESPLLLRPMESRQFRRKKEAMPVILEKQDTFSCRMFEFFSATYITLIFLQHKKLS